MLNMAKNNSPSECNINVKYIDRPERDDVFDRFSSYVTTITLFATYSITVSRSVDQNDSF